MTYSRGKWGKHQILSRSSLASSLPRTRKMARYTLFSLLDQYGKVMVKPGNGWGGMGIIQVASHGNGKYEVHSGKNKRIIYGRYAMYAYVRSKTKGPSHIVQRKIALAKVGGRPFDVRVMLQRKKRSGWVITGTLAKIAGSGYIITNTALSKGRVVPVSTAVKKSNIKVGYNFIRRRIHYISLKTAKKLQPYYRIHTVGVDLGIDAKGKVWIIEANFKPSTALFLRLRDKSMYRRMISYSKGFFRARV